MFKKNYIIIFIVFSFVQIFSQSLEIDYESFYSDNVFELSDKDLTKFENGLPEFDYINTSDDFINAISLRTNLEKKIGGLRLRLLIKPKYSYYLSNNDKSSFSFLTGLLSSYDNYDLNFYYGYYPDNYLKNYEDRDGSQELEKYDYKKNLFKVTANRKFWKKNYALLYSKFENYFYNKYFTEYDASAYTLGIGYKRIFDTFYLKLFYYYRNLETDNHINNAAAISDLSQYEGYRDASYESNSYSIELKNKKIDLSDNLELRPIISYRFTQKFYVTDLPIEYQDDNIDQIHSTRVDETYYLKINFIFYLNDKTEIGLNYDHEYRSTSSDYSSLSDIKDFTQDSIGISYNYRIDF